MAFLDRHGNESHGKDVDAPEFNGANMTFREYTRRVDNFVANTTAPTWRLAGRLIEKLTGDAWEHWEALGSSSELQQWDGVDELMRHLEGRFEMIENFRVGRKPNDLTY